MAQNTELNRVGLHCCIFMQVIVGYLEGPVFSEVAHSAKSLTNTVLTDKNMGCGEICSSVFMTLVVCVRSLCPHTLKHWIGDQLSFM